MTTCETCARSGRPGYLLTPDETEWVVCPTCDGKSSGRYPEGSPLVGLIALVVLVLVILAAFAKAFS